MAHLFSCSFGNIPKVHFWCNTKKWPDMEFSGNQLRAARALLGMDQETLAKRIGVSDNTIRNMEASGAEPVGGFASTRAKVHLGLEALGVEFTNGNEPGVKLRVRAKGKHSKR
jgi:transcriptional regulator with XRE-family HTH domain